MKQYRCERVADVIVREVANILKTRISDPRLQYVTITACRVTKDIRIAYIYYSVMGINPDPDPIRKGLDSACGFIRRELGAKLELRYIPELRFEFDQSLEDGNRIWETLESIGGSEGNAE
ncbi:30S ribosome-binding factor RbfA [bacterium]|nr:30S ribosome-binding factor RbfA [candidate division CSSED10-310 bacterium]